MIGGSSSSTSSSTQKPTKLSTTSTISTNNKNELLSKKVTELRVISRGLKIKNIYCSLSKNVLIKEITRCTTTEIMQKEEVAIVQEIYNTIKIRLA